MFRPPFIGTQKQEFCSSCHENFGRRRFDAIYPPYRTKGKSDFSLQTFSHNKHIEVDKLACVQCHRPSTERGAIRISYMERIGHPTCGDEACHGNAVQPVMSDCVGCHLPNGSVPATNLASKTESVFRVRGAYSHQRHAEVSKQNDCANCHINTGVEAGQTVPLPPMIACERCHDGTNAFFALGTKCKNCHKLAPEEQPQLTASPAEVEYKHAVHDAKGVPLTCDKCHAADKAGRVKFPVYDDHRPCASCHEHKDDFRTRDAKICKVCHLTSDPFRVNPVRKKFREKSEFWVALSHLSHSKVDCAQCHAKEAGKPEPTVAPGLLAPAHELCGSCHQDLQKPLMNECASCHKALHDLPPARQAAKWRVSTNFSHESHARDPRTAKVVSEAAVGKARVDMASASKTSCDECHSSVRASTAQAPAPRPTMHGCATCHQGVWAFKTTGVDCVRCHGVTPVEAMSK